MSTQSVIERYFEALERKAGWESLLADDIVFTSLTLPTKRITGKQAFLEGTQRFYSSIQTFELKQLLVDGARACALTRYRLNGSAGPFHSDVAEIYTVREGQIDSLDIYFDTAPFPK